MAQLNGVFNGNYKTKHRSVAKLIKIQVTLKPPFIPHSLACAIQAYQEANDLHARFQTNDHRTKAHRYSQFLAAIAAIRHLQTSSTAQPSASIQ